MFVHGDRFPVRRLRHELAHVFAGAFGDPVFGIALRWLPFPRLASGLVEGAAEAADFGDPDGRATVHQEARAMIAAGLAPPLAKVVGAGFTTLAGARAYTIAGSFSHFLLSTRGAEKFRAAYRSGGDFAGVYGQSLAQLEQQWRTFLETQPLDASERARARERFRRPAIFAKVCARDLAARVGEARARLYSLPDEAVDLWQAICQDDPGEPSYRLDLAEALFTSGELRWGAGPGPGGRPGRGRDPAAAARAPRTSPPTSTTTPAASTRRGSSCSGPRCWPPRRASSAPPTPACARCRTKRPAGRWAGCCSATAPPAAWTPAC